MNNNSIDVGNRLSENLKLPIEIDPNRIGLPSNGATIHSIYLFKKGDTDPSGLAHMFGWTYPADVYKLTGAIHSVDKKAPDIHFEVGIPVLWNKKMIQQGGGGVNGYIPPCSMPLHGQVRGEGDALEQGYLIFGSDSGHQMNPEMMMDCSWGSNQECFENFAYHSLKKVKDAVVALIDIVFNMAPEKVYFYGGSNGGRECMKAIQNYPDDYDGAICFFPVLYWVLKVLMDVRNGDLFEELGDEAIIDKQKFERIVEAAMELCDEQDGLKDHIISNYEAMPLLKSKVIKNISTFLNTKQKRVLEIFDTPLILPYPLAYGEVSLSGYQVYEGVSLHGHFSSILSERSAPQLSAGDSLIKHIFVKNPNFDVRFFDVNYWKERILEVSQWMDAYSENLDAFMKKGGKLILVQGTSDPLVTANGTIDYFHRLQNRYGKTILDRFMKFYLIPGYGHGNDGDFLAVSDFINALDQWVEKGIEPIDLIISDRNELTKGRTRPLYEYPNYPVYQGYGDVNDYASFRGGKYE